MEKWRISTIGYLVLYNTALVSSWVDSKLNIFYRCPSSSPCGGRPMYWCRVLTAVVCACFQPAILYCMLPTLFLSLLFLSIFSCPYKIKTLKGPRHLYSCYFSVRGNSESVVEWEYIWAHNLYTFWIKWYLNSCIINNTHFLELNDIC